MTKDEMDVDTVVLRTVEAEIGADRFEVWFGRRVGLELSSDRLHVSAPTRFLADQLESMFHHQLRAAARKLAGEGAEVAYRVAASPATTSPETTSSATTSHAVRNTSSPASAHRSPDGQDRASGAESEAGSAGKGGTRRARRRFASLEEFVVGPCNQVVWSSLQAVLHDPGGFSPLLIWGPPGTGKSHLLEGVWGRLRREGQQRVVYLTAEQFTSMYVETIRADRGLPSFRHKYRSVDVLLVDDVQFFANKRATVVEFQHTLDALQRAGRQVVLTSDRPPHELESLGNELLTRLSGGLVCGISLPDEATRIGILKRFAARMQSTPFVPADALSESIFRAVAKLVPGDGRQLRGALNQVVAASAGRSTPLRAAHVESLLATLASSFRRPVELSDIERAVCEVFGVKAQSLHSNKRTRQVAQPRMLAMWLARKYTPAVYAEIGEYFGRRSHATVISAAKTVERWVDEDARMTLYGGECSVREAIERVESHLRRAQ